MLCRADHLRVRLVARMLGYMRPAVGQGLRQPCATFLRHVPGQNSLMGCCWPHVPPNAPTMPRPRRCTLCVVASQTPRRRPNLLTQLLSIPRRVDSYFAGRVLRQALWIFISFGAGYYSANVVSLSFGAIAVNDVIAAVFTVAFVEIVSKIVYEAEKMGVTAALIADALKLGG